MGVRSFVQKLRRSQSGNAMMLVGLGLPALIGGTGLAVDTAQWYLWKRELQYAADQAAIAGAWARADMDSRDDYDTRAEQEFDANVGVTEDFVAEPNISLADYDGETDASVLVTVTATRSLPFSGYLLDQPVTIAVRAQATNVPAEEFTTCMLALDPSATDAFILGGSADGNAPCGFGALSDASTAMRKNGNPGAWANQLVSNGGIDSGYSANGTIYQNVGSLENPYDGISPPDDTTPQTYFCPTASPAKTGKSADVTITKEYNYEYYKGRNKTQATLQPGYAGRNADYSTTTGPENTTVADNASDGTTTTVTPASFNKNDLVEVSGSGANVIFEWLQVTTRTTYENTTTTTIPASDGVARPEPGTYANINIACDTEFQPGVYVVEGDLDFGDNVSVSGDNVMFVMESGNKIHINNGSELTFTGISSDTLENVYGVDPATAIKMAGMLFYDPDSDEEFKMNGHASLELNGIMYMPGRHVWFNGNSNLSGSCLQIAAGTITLNGNFDVNIFCVASEANPFAIGAKKSGVRLVA